MRFGTAPVFFTAISTILGAILFLRFGYAVGTLGVFGALLIVMIGHMVTVPTALAISEIATNKRVEGGGEYFIISRSFGLNIGATIGIALYLSQAISVAFYVIAFTEAFTPFFNWFAESYGYELPRQAISLPAMLILGLLILTKGANLGVKTLYVVVVILFAALVLFFVGKTNVSTDNASFFEGSFRNMNSFFVVFAIIFPAFTGMTAGVGLSGDLKNPGKSIPLGTLSATFIGLIVYVFIIYKLSISASVEELVNDQLIMAKIALYGGVAIPLGLAASTISSALGSIMVAPRTLQALGSDRSFPLVALNRFFAKGKGASNEPRNASLVTVSIAFVFVLLGNVNSVAQIISMFFMVTYGSICLISFLNHFGSDPSYRPVFRSHWFISMLGFLMSLWLMFQINTVYAVLSIVLIILIYIGINHYHKERQGLQSIFKGAIFQLNRQLQVYLQKSGKMRRLESWRPSVVCVSKDSFQRDEAFNLLNWISYKYGFGTYIHLIEGYYSAAAQAEAQILLKKLIVKSEKKNSKVYIDTLISPSYTSAIAQTVQLPGISGMENNMILFEYDKASPINLKQIIDNYNLVRAGKNDICILGSSHKSKIYDSIHVWIRSFDYENANLMILLSYIIWGHPDWKKASIKIFDITEHSDMEKHRMNLVELMKSGRIPITPKNIEVIRKDENISSKSLINEKSEDAGLTIIGIRPEHIRHHEIEVFKGYDNVGDVLFVSASAHKEIE